MHPTKRASTKHNTQREERLRALLDADCKTGSVVVGLRKNISRKHYAKLLSCSPSSLSQFSKVFSEYERDLMLAPGRILDIPKMIEWLNAAYEEGELDIRDGKLDRSAFKRQFDLSRKTFDNHCPTIRALFMDLDARAKNEGYLASDRRKELDRVKKALTMQPKLNKDRISINLEELSKVTRVPKHRFSERGFADALSARHAEILIEVKASKIDPYFHGRVFPFSQLANLWPDQFLERVGVRFKQLSYVGSIGILA